MVGADGLMVGDDGGGRDMRLILFFSAAELGGPQLLLMFGGNVFVSIGDFLIN